MSTAVAKTDVPQSKTLDQYAKAINAAKGKSNELMFDVAENLKLAHDELANHKSGSFGAWVKVRCGFTVRTAEKYLRVLKVFGEEYRELGSQYIDASAMYYLAKDTTPEEALTDAVDAARSGEHVNLNRAKEFAEQYTIDAEATAEAEGDDDSDWDDEPADLAKSWSPAACALAVRPVVAKWAKLCPATDTKDLAQILRDLADQVEKGAWNER